MPVPCISGWKFEDGETVRLATLGAQCGVFPVFSWEKGKGGSVKDCPREAAERPSLEEFMGIQRRFTHLVYKEPKSGTYAVRAGREADMQRMRDWVQSNVERLYKLAELK